MFEWWRFQTNIMIQCLDLFHTPWGKKGKGKQPAIKTEKVLVYDERNFIREAVPVGQIPASARKTRIGRGAMIVMERRADGQSQIVELRPFNPATALLPDAVNISPRELYDALDWDVEVSFEVVESPWLQRIKSGVMIALVGICLFALFMIASAVFQG